MTKQERAQLTAMLDEFESSPERHFDASGVWASPFDMPFSDAPVSYEYRSGRQAVINAIRDEFGL